MKNVYLLAVLFICSFCLAQTDSPKYTLTAGKPEIKKESGQRWLQIPVTLTNTTADTLKYATMTCSWQYSYTVDKPSVKIEEIPCDKNITNRIILPPYQNNTVPLRLYTINIPENQPLTFSIGHKMVLLDTLKSGKVIRDEMHKTKPVWTQPITFSSFKHEIEPKIKINPWDNMNGYRFAVGYTKDLEAEASYLITSYPKKDPGYGGLAMLVHFVGIGAEYIKDGPRNAVGAKLSYEASFSLLIAQIGADYLYSEAGNQARIMPKVGLSAFGFVTVYYGWNINTIKDSGLQPYKHLLSLQINILDIFL